MNRYVEPITAPKSDIKTSTKPEPCVREADSHIKDRTKPKTAIGMGRAKIINKNIINIFCFISIAPFFYNIGKPEYICFNSQSLIILI